MGVRDLGRELGIAIVDKATVPLQLGTVTVTVAGAITIPARIVFLHPYLNFGLIQVGNGWHKCWGVSFLGQRSPLWMFVHKEAVTMVECALLRSISLSCLPLRHGV